MSKKIESFAEFVLPDPTMKVEVNLAYRSTARN